MQLHPLAPSIGYRVRLQCLADARIFNGWLISASADGCVVEIEGERSPEPESTLNIQVVNDGYVLIGKAVAKSSKSDERVYKLPNKQKSNTAYRMQKCIVELQTDWEFKRIASSEECRMLCEPLTVGLASSGDDYTDTIAIDLSANGIGVLTVMPWGRGHKIEFTVPTLEGDILGSGEIRYSRRLQSAPPVYRVGVQVESIDRLDAEKWTRLTSRQRKAA